MAFEISVNEYDDDLINKIKSPAESLRKGNLVIFPTETVYGIAARADILSAVQKIYKAKNRPEGKPFAYHIGSMEMLYKITGELPTEIDEIFKKYLPGPYTFLLNINNKKVGIRFPKCKIAQCFLNQCACPVMATSANISGEPSPTNIQMTAAVQKHVAYIIDAGETVENGESTVIDLTVSPPKVIRQGSGKWK